MEGLVLLGTVLLVGDEDCVGVGVGAAGAGGEASGGGGA